MTQLYVALIGVAGVAVGIGVQGVLQSKDLRIKKMTIFAQQNLDAYVSFGQLAGQVQDLAHAHDADAITKIAILAPKLGDARSVIDSLGEFEVVKAAHHLENVFKQYHANKRKSLSGPDDPRNSATLIIDALAIIHAVGEYRNAVRKSFDVDPIDWEVIARLDSPHDHGGPVAPSHP